MLRNISVNATIFLFSLYLESLGSSCSYRILKFEIKIEIRQTQKVSAVRKSTGVVFSPLTSSGVTISCAFLWVRDHFVKCSVLPQVYVKTLPVELTSQRGMKSKKSKH